MSNSEKLNRLLDFLENLKSEDLKQRVEAMQNLHLIVQAFGVAKTRSQLLPFLKEFKDDETEVMLALAQQLKFIGNFISQQEMHLAECIPYFYLCLNYEDISVIETAIQSLRFLVEKFKFKHESIIALGKKLYQTQYTKSMIASVWLCCELAEYIPSKYAGELHKIVQDAANSKITLVRRYCAFSLRFILKDKCPFMQMADQCLKQLIQDQQDTVKIYAAQTLCYFKHPKSFFMKNIFPLLKIVMSDKSWRVQYAVVSQLDNVLISVQSNNKKNIVEFYLNCLQSKEEELVVKSFTFLKNFAMMLEPDIVIKKIIPVLKENSQSKNLAIKIAIAGSVPYIAPAIGKSNTTTHLQQLVTKLLSDGDQKVVVEILKNLDAFNSVLALQILSDSLMNALKIMLDQQDWKLRKNAVQTLKIMLLKITDEKINKEILDMLQNTLQDKVFEVRKTALIVLSELCKELGQQWTENKALKILNTCMQQQNYLHRLNYFFGLQLIYQYLGAKSLQVEISNVCKMVKDQVPNIRINVVRTLLMLSQNQLDIEVQDKIAKILKFLEKDNDHDITTMVKKINELGYKTAALAIMAEV